MREQSEAKWEEQLQRSLERERVNRRLKRIREIATEIVTNMVAKGDLDPSDDAALRAAVVQAGKDAAAVYDAAMEYLS